MSVETISTALELLPKGGISGDCTTDVGDYFNSPRATTG